MARTAWVLLAILGYAAAITSKEVSDESCSTSCDKSFTEREKSLACRRGCRFYSLIHLIAPPSPSKNVTAESCVLACREASDMKDMQDTCTIGCTLQRIFVTKNEDQLSGQPLIETLLDSDSDKLASEEIIRQFMEFSSKMQLFAAQLFQDLVDEETMLESGGESETILQVREGAIGMPATHASLSVRTYSIDQDGRVTLVDELDREYTFVYSCFSLQVDAPFQRRMKQLLTEPIRTFKRLFSFSHSSGKQPEMARVVDVPGGVVEIRRSDVLLGDSDPEVIAGARMEGAMDISFVDTVNKRDFDWFFCVAARNIRLHCILLGLFALSCVGLLCACWVSLGHFSGGRKVRAAGSDCCDDDDDDSSEDEDEDEPMDKKVFVLDLDADSPLAPPPYDNAEDKKAGVPVCVNDDDVLLCVVAETAPKAAVQTV